MGGQRIIATRLSFSCTPGIAFDFLLPHFHLFSDSRETLLPACLIFRVVQMLKLRLECLRA
jgi:hypothetical protein